MWFGNLIYPKLFKISWMAASCLNLAMVDTATLTSLRLYNSGVDCEAISGC